MSTDIPSISNVVHLPGHGPARPASKKRARAPKKLRAPVNSLCCADQVVDVIYPARQIVRFLQLTNRMRPTDGEPASNEYREGQDLILGLVGDALKFAEQMAERREP